MAKKRLSKRIHARMMTATSKLNWTGWKDFVSAQAQVAVILFIAYLGNNFPKSYPRNDNEDPKLFWMMNAFLLVAVAFSLKRVESTRGVQLLSRPQTEEWKGWMQWAFIFYHYYRVYNVYNEIRLFVSAYVWMTGFGNFLYFDKKQDFSLDRIVSMWLRINYFPILLSIFLGVKLELYYVVPLHTAGFFITMITCYIAKLLQNHNYSYWISRIAAVGLCALVHILFYETSLVQYLELISHEYSFRFQSDKYSALVGIVSGLLWKKLGDYMQWAHGTNDHPYRTFLEWAQRLIGLLLIALWYNLFGFISDKYTYNPIHPFIFWIPLVGWLMIRNSSKYLTELHSTVLEFFGRITLETYVLQFHVFMCHNVQHIPIIIPGSGGPGSDGDSTIIARVANMLLCGVIFVSLALWARKVTITTQTTVVELMQKIRQLVVGPTTTGEIEDKESELVKLTTTKDDDGDDDDDGDKNSDVESGKLEMTTTTTTTT